MPMRLLAAEITREKIFLQLKEELPYASTVETDKWEERRDGSVKVDQTIYVQRDGQKAIVLGKGGGTIKIIGELARADATEEKIGLMMAGVAPEQAHAEAEEHPSELAAVDQQVAEQAMDDGPSTGRHAAVAKPTEPEPVEKTAELDEKTAETKEKTAEPDEVELTGVESAGVEQGDERRGSQS